MPWTIRNYLVFGRFIPTKSNVALELYQSQCLQTDGVIFNFAGHPYGNSKEGSVFNSLKEIAYLDLKWKQFCEAVEADPLDFGDRIGARFLAATLWYVPFQDMGRPWTFQLRRLTHPLPFLALIFLIFTSFPKPLHPAMGGDQRLCRLPAAVHHHQLLRALCVSAFGDQGFAGCLGSRSVAVFWASRKVADVSDLKFIVTDFRPAIASLTLAHLFFVRLSIQPGSIL